MTPFSVGSSMGLSSLEQEVAKISKLTRTRRKADLPQVCDNAEGFKLLDRVDVISSASFVIDGSKDRNNNLNLQIIIVQFTLIGKKHGIFC
jgi:hypothetical protein